MTKTIGLALSGGGARGAAHIGLLQFLEEQGLAPKVIAGTSAGAIVGALYAAGHPAEKVLQIFKEIPLFDFSNFTWFKPGLLDSEKFTDDLGPYFEKDQFESLETDLYITATKILTGELEVFHTGSIIQAMLASAAFPGIFSPMRIGEHLYVDGGVFNNFPTDIIREKCDILIGLNLNPIDHISEKEVKNTFGILRRVYELAIRKQATENQRYCDICLTDQQLANFGLFDQDRADVLFDIGYEAAKKQRDRLLELIGE